MSSDYPVRLNFDDNDFPARTLICLDLYRNKPCKITCIVLMKSDIMYHS